MSEHFLVLVNTVGTMAICALLYGLIQRRVRNSTLRRAGVGLALGCGGIVIMMQPIILSPGLQADARGAFVGMAAAFGGPIAAVIAMTLTMSARAIIGGSGALVGVLAIAATTAGALLWRYRVGSPLKRQWGAWLAICAICIGPTAFTLFAVTGMVSQASLFLSIVISLVVLIFGKMLEVEQRRGRRERELAKEASTDSLTDLPNRRSLEKYAQELEREKAVGVLFLLLDLDYFKKINDEYGHDAGDAVLREIGSAIRRTVRDTDFAARVGGEEFAIIVRTRNTHTGRLVAERFRTALQVPFGNSHQTRVSIGGAFFDEGPFTYSEGYHRADRALYAAKTLGRNRVTIFQGDEEKLQLAS